MNSERLEEIREFLNQPDDVYEAAPGIALELLKAVDELRAALRELIEEVDPGPSLCRQSLLDTLARARRLLDKGETMDEKQLEEIKFWRKVARDFVGHISHYSFRDGDDYICLFCGSIWNIHDPPEVEEHDSDCYVALFRAGLGGYFVDVTEQYLEKYCHSHKAQ